MQCRLRLLHALLLLALAPLAGPAAERDILDVARDHPQGTALNIIAAPRPGSPAGTNTNPGPLVPVAGRVFDTNRSPVANARVGIFRGINPDNAACPRSVKPEECLDYLLSIGADRAHAVTGEDGRFTSQVPGGLVLYADTLWVEGANARGERLRTSRQIDASAGLPAQMDNIVLQQVADFTALIQHEGEPIADAQVSFLPTFLHGDPQQTDATGSVTSHRSLNVQDSVYMMVRAEGFATEYRRGAIRPGTTTHVIDLLRESVLTGSIVGPAGKPLAQATLTAVFVPDDLFFPLYWDPVAGTARSDDAGMFTLHGLRADQSYRLLINADDPSIASSEWPVTAGSGPIKIALNTAVPVTLAISGLRGLSPVRGLQSAGYVGRLNASLNKMVIERALSEQPELVQAVRVGNGPGLTILMEWLDPDTGAWLPVRSHRKVTVRDATHADLRFDKVPVGTIRISTTGGLPIAVQTFDPVTIRAGRPVVIPVRVTALQQVEVKVIDQEGRPASGVRIEVGSADGAFTSHGNAEMDGTFTFDTDPTRDMNIRVITADKVISMPVPRGAARSRPLVVKVRL